MALLSVVITGSALRVTGRAGRTADSSYYTRLFLRFPCFILNRNSQCWRRVLLWYWKMKRTQNESTKKSRTSRSRCEEKTRSCCTKIIKRWWISLEVGFCSCFLREAGFKIRHTKELRNILLYARTQFEKVIQLCKLILVNCFQIWVRKMFIATKLVELDGGNCV